MDCIWFRTANARPGADDPTDKGFAGSVDADGDYEMTGNFWDMDTSGQTSTAGNATGKTTSEMKNRDTFTDAGWDFENTWCINGDRNDGYSYLQWQQFDEVGTRDTLIILVIMVVTVIGSVAFILLRRKRTEEHEHKDEDL